MNNGLTTDEQRARDALAFDPMPFSEWVVVTDEGVVVRSYFNDRPNPVVWAIDKGRLLSDYSLLFPFSSAAEIGEKIPALDRAARRWGLAKDIERRRNYSSGRFTCEDLGKHEGPLYRRMSDQYLDEIGPFVPLECELIGWNTYQMTRNQGCPRPAWVARIVGRTAWGWDRVWESGDRDYSSANRVGSRGIMEIYRLYNGPIYEVRRQISCRDYERFYARVASCQILKMTEQEVIECLK